MEKKEKQKVKENERNLPYMNLEELNDFLRIQTQFSLTKPEIEYLHLDRRRKSLELVFKNYFLI